MSDVCVNVTFVVRHMDVVIGSHAVVFRKHASAITCLTNTSKSTKEASIPLVHTAITVVYWCCPWCKIVISESTKQLWTEFVHDMIVVVIFPSINMELVAVYSFFFPVWMINLSIPIHFIHNYDFHFSVFKNKRLGNYK